MRFVKCDFFFMDGKSKNLRRVPAPASRSPYSLRKVMRVRDRVHCKPQQPPPDRWRIGKQRVLFSVVEHGIIFL